MKTAALLIGPLAIVFGIRRMLFGPDGPAANDMAAQAMFRVLVMAYGIYLIALSIIWSRRRQRNERR
jgi:uncharacterized membrane protein